MQACNLAFSTVTANGAAPSQWMFFLHGIFGSGANWRTFAKRFVEARPSWGAALVDLRMHGASQNCAPPHTIEAAALRSPEFIKFAEGRRAKKVIVVPGRLVNVVV